MTRRRQYFKWVIILSSSAFVYLTGVHQYVTARSYNQYYTHQGPSQPLNYLVQQLNSGNAALKPVSEFLYNYKHMNLEKCAASNSIRLLIVVKSAIQNSEKRMGIRTTWGLESLFKDAKIRTIFLIGINLKEPHLQKMLEAEANGYRDIVQADFIDYYYNNTLKALMGLDWTYKYCEKVEYFLFIDDDYYVSTKNVLHFLVDPRSYPQHSDKPIATHHQDLFAGYVFKGSIPIRWIFNKWYVSLDEYPYSKWPPYVTAGAYILSRKSLVDLYFGSIYTKLFRFDDIFLGMAAKKANIKPFHHREFYFERKPYDKQNFKWVIASHGYGDPMELQEVWSQQRSAGYA